MTVETPWSDLWLSADDWAEAFAAAEPGAAHNEVREQVFQELLTILIDKDNSDVAPESLRNSLAQNRELRTTFNRAWPLVDAADLVGDLWTVPAYLRRCAPWLDPEEVRTLQREDAKAWTVSDLPLLDAAGQRLGDPQASRRAQRQRAATAAEHERMADVVADLVATDDSEMQVMSMLRGQDLKDALLDEAALPSAEPDLLAGPFAHVVVDEAQELTDAQWQMLLLRCPSRSFTVVGDRAQARQGFTESWQERLARVGLDRITETTLSINYRTPQEIMAEAEPVIRAVLPDANVPLSVRGSGLPVRHGSVSQLGSILDAWLSEHADGTACVITDRPGDERAAGTSSRVRWLTPELSKGLEFDLVVLVDPESFGDSSAGVIGTAVDRYVAMTRATQQLVILSRVRARSSRGRSGGRSRRCAPATCRSRGSTA